MRPGGALAAVARAGAIALIRGYQVTLSPFLGGHCRFHPSCSAYGVEAFRLHPPARAAWLTVRRLARCHPLGGRGFDPVPEPAPPGGSPGRRDPGAPAPEIPKT